MRPDPSHDADRVNRGDPAFIANGLRVAYLAESMQRTEAYLRAVAAMQPPPVEVAQPPAAPIEPAQPVRPAPPQPQPRATWSEPAFAAELMAMINRERAAAGLAALAPNAQLQTSATGFARTLAASRTFSHSGPDGSTIGGRIAAAGYPTNVVLGEIIAFGAGSAPATIMSMWMGSGTHREQILSGAFIAAGAGCASDGVEIRCVVDFGG